MSKEAMKLALEALKQIDEAMPFPVAKLAQSALREALAEQKSGIKQVIELYDSPDQPSQHEPVAKDNSNYRLDPPGLDPLYTSPPPQRTWVGLTDDEIWKDDAIMSANSGYGATFDTLRDMVRAVEAKLKEKNQ